MQDYGSVLRGDFVTAQGTHRYFCEQTTQTAEIVETLISGSEDLAAVEVAYPEAFHDDFHQHEQGQATYILSGVMTFSAEGQSFVVPAGHLIWLPRQMLHAASARHDVHFISIYEQAEATSDLPGTCRVIQASDLLKNVFERVIAHQIAREKGPVFDALVVLLADEIRASLPGQLSIPMPKDPRLYRICEHILRAPTVTVSKARLSAIGNVSARTMSRLFKAEFNMTFTDWLHHVLIMTALRKLGRRGASVAAIASELGYDSPSAFAAMFRRHLGQSPSDFNAKTLQKTQAGG